MQTTYVPKEGEIARKWYLVDAAGVVLGRLCTVVARHLSGKTKACYVPYHDTGDHVVVINAGQVKLTGRKRDQKEYFRHSGYPSGLKRETAGSLLGRAPERLVQEGVKGMLPKSKLGRAMLSKLRVYAGPDHPHQAQQPVPLAIGGLRGGPAPSGDAQ